MLDLKLFLGFQLNPTLTEHLSRAPLHLVQLFTTGGDFLCTLEQENKRYLGKFPSPSPSLEDLELLEAHVVSLLKKLAPRYPVEAEPPRLFVVHVNG